MMKKITASFVALLIAAFFVLPSMAIAQDDDKVYDEGSVWNITFVKLKANMGEEYLKNLKNTWATAMDQYVDEGLMESYMILYGESFGWDDFDLMLMVEFKNFAQYDPDPERDKKFKEIENKLMESMGEEKMDATVKSYNDMRKIFGTKTMRQITLR
jgi:hypothetical protein